MNVNFLYSNFDILIKIKNYQKKNIKNTKFFMCDFL